MIQLHRRLAVAALAAASWLSPAANPRPRRRRRPQAVAAPAANENMKRLATEVYVYAFPLVLMDVTKQVQTAKVPVNTFQHRRASPDAPPTP